MDLNVLTESDILILESVIGTTLSKKDLQDPEKVRKTLEKIKDEIENPKISNVLVNKLIAVAISICIGAVLGAVSGSVAIATGSLSLYYFCLQIAPILKAGVHIGMMGKLADRENKIVRDIKKGIKKLETKRQKVDDPERKKILDENIKALRQSLEIAKKAQEEIRQEKITQAQDHPVRSFAAKFFVAN